MNITNLASGLLGGGGSRGFVSTNTGILPPLVQPATIGDLSCDVVISRTTTFESEVTEYPVEDGFSISDHVTRKPLKLSLDVLFTPTPVTWFNSLLGGGHKLDVVLKSIAQMYQMGAPITITLPDGIYTDMVMTSASMPRNVQDGYCYKCSLEFVHVRRVVQRTEDVPQAYTDNDAAGKAGTTVDAGAASTTNIGTGLEVVDATQAKPSMTTNNIDLSQYGSVGTGLEATAYMAAYSIFGSTGGAGVLW